MSKEAQQRIEAALALLDEKTTTKAKFESLRTLLKGIHPRIDQHLRLVSRELERVEKVQKGEVIELAASELPEHTEEQRRRKKAILLLINSWKQLKSEVKRVQGEFEKAKEHGGSQEESRVSALSKILARAKGPLGVITLAAVAIVALQSLAVKIVIKNVGCEPIQVTSFAIPLPGLQLPKEPIPNGGSAVAVVPPFDLSVDGKTPGVLRLKALGMQFHFNLQAADITLNGSSLWGRQTPVRLSERKEHELIIRCS